MEQPLESGASSIIASRIDFARVNAQLSGDLHSATNGHLNGASLSHLLLYGWLPRQRQKTAADKVTNRTAENEPIPGSVPLHAQHTRLHVVRYQSLNRFIAIFWDASETHEVVLTLQRESVFHRWYVTKVAQFNVCAYDFDCAQVPIPDLPSRIDVESPMPVSHD